MGEHVWLRREPQVRSERGAPVRVARRPSVVVGPADDRHEREADTLAERIVRPGEGGAG